MEEVREKVEYLKRYTKGIFLLALMLLSMFCLFSIVDCFAPIDNVKDYLEKEKNYISIYTHNYSDYILKDIDKRNRLVCKRIYKSENRIKEFNVFANQHILFTFLFFSILPIILIKKIFWKKQDKRNNFIFIFLYIFYFSILAGGYFFINFLNKKREEIIRKDFLIAKGICKESKKKIKNFFVKNEKIRKKLMKNIKRIKGTKKILRNEEENILIELKKLLLKKKEEFLKESNDKNINKKDIIIKLFNMNYFLLDMFDLKKYLNFFLVYLDELEVSDENIDEIQTLITFIDKVKKKYKINIDILNRIEMNLIVLIDYIKAKRDLEVQLEKEKFKIAQIQEQIIKNLDRIKLKLGKIKKVNFSITVYYILTMYILCILQLLIIVLFSYLIKKCFAKDNFGF